MCYNVLAGHKPRRMCGFWPSKPYRSATRSLYKRHPEIKLRWSQQLDRIRGSKGNYQAIKLFFDNVLATPPATAPPPASPMFHLSQNRWWLIVFIGIVL